MDSSHDSNRKEPFVQFQEFKLDTRILAGIQTLGWEQPTPIQEQAIPRALEGRDVMGLARTGTGKTAAFLLPILQRLATGPRGHVRALIVAPTRELAEQIHQQAVALCRPLNLRSLSIYGGVNINPQMRALRAGVDIVVACPGRLLDHLGQRTVEPRARRGARARRGRPDVRHGLPPRHAQDRQAPAGEAPDAALLGDDADGGPPPGRRDPARPGHRPGRHAQADAAPWPTPSTRWPRT